MARDELLQLIERGRSIALTTRAVSHRLREESRALRERAARASVSALAPQGDFVFAPRGFGVARTAREATQIAAC